MTFDTAEKPRSRAIRASKLPNRTPTDTWGGQGSGRPCALCGEPITPDEFELELRFGMGGAVRESYCVHVDCCTVWAFECHKLAPSPDETPSHLPSIGGPSSVASDERSAGGS